MKKKYFVLANGKVFEGKGFGYDSQTIGELVFTTGMGGYIQTLTDPSYYGQIVMQTFPLIGNYGIIEQDFESDKPFVKGYVVREHCETPSNFRMQKTLNEYLVENKIIGICDVDTREITRIVRECGVMNSCITNEVTTELIESLNNYKIIQAVENTSTRKIKVISSKSPQKYNVVMIDYGMKNDIANMFAMHGCKVTVVPHDTTAKEVLDLNPDGIILSNGPGDPCDNPYCIKQIEELIGMKPIFGICLGHQLFALAVGAKTEKLKHAHRGTNQPVKRLFDNHIFITNQNHGYTVVPESISKSGIVTFINTNDNTCEGIDYPSLKAFTVQFNPESYPGTNEPDFLLDKFCIEMEADKLCH